MQGCKASFNLGKKIGLLFWKSYHDQKVSLGEGVDLCSSFGVSAGIFLNAHRQSCQIGTARDVLRLMLDIDAINRRRIMTSGGNKTDSFHHVSIK